MCPFLLTTGGAQQDTVQLAQWLSSTQAQCMAALTALAGVFGVYKLQQLSSSYRSEVATAVDALRKLVPALGLVPADFGAINIYREMSPHDYFAAIREAKAKIDGKTAERSKPRTLGETAAAVSVAFGATIALLPYNEFAAAHGRVIRLSCTMRVAKSRVALGLILPAVACVIQLLALLLVPLYTATSRPPQMPALVAVVCVAFSVAAIVAVVWSCISLVSLGADVAEPTSSTKFRPVHVEISPAEAAKVAEMQSQFLPDRERSGETGDDTESGRTSRG